LLHAFDAAGAAVAPDDRRRTSVHVRGGVGGTRVDLDELGAIDALLDGVVRDAGHLESALAAARRDLVLDAAWAPAAAARAEDAVDDAVAGRWGVRRLGAPACEPRMAARDARMLYDAAALAARPPPA